METIDKIKLAFVALFTAVNTVLGLIAIPFYVLVGCNILDYATGMMAAPYRKEKINSDKGFRGIFKKVCMWLLVGLGMIVDYLIAFAAQTMGMDISLPYIIAVAVILWLLVNELLSILENMADIGTPIPTFLRPILEKMRDSIDSK